MTLERPPVEVVQCRAKPQPGTAAALQAEFRSRGKQCLIAAAVLTLVGMCSTNAEASETPAPTPVITQVLPEDTAYDPHTGTWLHWEDGRWHVAEPPKVPTVVTAGM